MTLLFREYSQKTPGNSNPQFRRFFGGTTTSFSVSTCQCF